VKCLLAINSIANKQIPLLFGVGPGPGTKLKWFGDHPKGLFSTRRAGSSSYSRGQTCQKLHPTIRSSGPEEAKAIVAGSTAYFGINTVNEVTDG